MPVITPRPATVESPQKRGADERVAGAAVQAGLLVGNADQFRVTDGEEDAREKGDAAKEIEARHEPIVEEKAGADGGDDGLDVEDDVDDGGVAVLEREGEEDGPNRGAGEAGKVEVAPGAPHQSSGTPLA